MIAKIDHSPDPLETTLQRVIIERTAGRLRHLRIEVHEDRIVIQGTTSSYYVKQLAIDSILKALDGSQIATLDMVIEVDDAPSASWHRR